MRQVIFALAITLFTLPSFTTKENAAKKLAATPFSDSFTDTYTYTFYNDCTGEEVEITGTTTYDTRGVINNNKISYTSHVTVNDIGIGQTSGKMYTGHIADNYSFSSNFTGVYLNNTVTNGILATAGGGNNIKFHYSYHVTVNANGEVVVERGSSEYDCQ